MKKIFNYILFAGLLAFVWMGCDDKDSITPAEITDVTSETRPGEIIIRWNTPKDASIEYIKVTYNDPRLKKDVTRLASIFADSIVIPDTRARYPEYEFKVQTVSPTGDLSVAQTVMQKSDPAPPITIDTRKIIELTEKDLETNAQESSEGPIKNLIDDDTSTFFHTAWSGTSPDVHWMGANLNKTLEGHYAFYYAPRNNSADKPIDFDLMGSMDGDNWELIKKFTQEEDNLPTTAKDAYTSPSLPCPFPFNRIRIVVNKTNSGKKFFTMSEFKFYDVEYSFFNPETDEED